MEPKFQTSFIPRKPMASTMGPAALRTPQPKRGTSIFFIIGVLAFILSLAAVGGAYGWKQYLLSQQEADKQALADRQKQFNTDLIEQLKRANIQIDTAKKLLADHIALSGLFSFIQQLTIAKVRFTSLDATVGDPSGVKITMSGYGTDLKAVAYQSDVLGQLDQYGLRSFVKNPILSNPTLDPKGSVSFSLTATIDPSSLSYERTVSGPAPTPNPTP